MESSVSTKISPDDEMMNFMKTKGKLTDDYLKAGKIDASVFVQTIKKWRPSFMFGKKVLDYGCGHGRITRYLPKFIAPSKLVVADVWQSAINFCAQEFNGIPFLVSKDHPISELRLKFDIIISMSVFSHLPPVSFEFFLNDLSKTLADGGLLLFTTKGEYFSNKQGFSLNKGFHYINNKKKPNETEGRLKGDEYAFMCVSTKYVENLLKKIGLRLLEYKETAVRRQDLYVVEKN